MKFTRRSFLATSGILATGTTLGMSPFIFKEKETGVGIIGTGVRAQELARRIQTVQGLKTVACCDVIPYRLKEGLALAEPKAKGYNDYRKLLDDKNVDAVIIATPFSMHAQMTLDALDAGKHIFCEKTMVKGIEETHRVVKKAKASKVIFQTGHQYHHSRLYTRVVDMLHSGALGKIAAFECQWNRTTTWRRPTPEPEWDKLINWRMYNEYSGGLVAELSSHQLDFVNWVLKAHPTKVAGFGGIDYYKDGRETYDNIHLMYDYPEGVRAKFTCLTTNKYQGYQIKVQGEKGTIILDMNKATLYLDRSQMQLTEDLDAVTSATLKAMEQGIPIEVDNLDPTLQAIIDFREAIVTGEKPLSDVETGALASICVEMGNNAMKNERIEYWKESYNI
jgi:predicted dehydrogenase